MKKITIEKKQILIPRGLLVKVEGVPETKVWGTWVTQIRLNNLDEVYEIASTAKDDGSIREEYKEPKNSKLDETIDKVIYGLKDDYIIGIGANPLNIDFSLFVKIGKPKEINKLEKITETKKFFGLLKETNREIIIYPPFN